MPEGRAILSGEFMRFAPKFRSNLLHNPDPEQVDPRKAAASLFSRLSLSRFLPAGDGAHYTRKKEREKEKEERGADLAKRDAGAEI
ncbi:hypothetical protein FB451DRAFT_1404920 [Mycena latifolia]|nr:hypothetical protein FB451DRAFT_1404920 [Mycena latifolia]